MITSGTASEIAQRMQTGELIEAGGHHMLVYDSLDTLRQLFVSYAKTFLPKNEILVFGTQYDTMDNIERSLRRQEVDVSRHLDDGTLFIIDAQEGYQGADTHGIIKLAMSLVSRAEKENRRGVTVLGDVGSFFAFDKIDELVSFELSFPTKFEGNVMKTVCCYHRGDFKRLEIHEQNKLVEHHFKTIYSG